MTYQQLLHYLNYFLGNSLFIFVPNSFNILICRELPEPILSSYLTRFEEAAAVQNVATREVNLMSLVEKLPLENRTLLAWTILHLDTITQNVNIKNIQNF